MKWSNSLKITFGVESPCLDCPDRVPACHDRCERFAEYKRKLDEIKGKKRDFWDKEKLVHPGVKRSKGKWPRDK
jgi:hypothetical protein